MLTPEQINDMVVEVIEVMQHNDRSPKDDIPYRPTYAIECIMARDQKVHALGNYPVTLFERKVPNETNEQKEYRKQSFEPTTMPIWNKAVQSVQGRIWNKANYSIQWPDDDQSEYFTEYYPEHGSLAKWYQSIRLPQKMYDANAMMVVMPKQLPMVVNDEGEMIPDDTELIDPECMIYRSDQVIHRDRDHVMILLDERSTVMYNNKLMSKGLIFLLVDDTYYWKVTQIGKKVDYQFEIDVYYEHGLGYIPAESLAGVPKEMQGHKFYNSYFYPAVGDLNTALFDESTLAMAKIANIYPERWEVIEECYQCNGEGKLFEDGDYHSCEVCSGSGMRQRPHPLNSLTVKLPDRLDDRPTPPTPPAGYIEKDTESTKFLREEIIRKKEDAFANINIDVASRPNGQTATTSKIDREELFSFLLTISGEEFESLSWSIHTIGRLRYGDSWNDEITIDPPKDFTIRSHKELTEELAEAKTNNVPLAAQRKLVNEYNATRFNNDSIMAKEMELLYAADRLAGLSNQEALNQLSSGAAQVWEVVLHTSIDTFIEQQNDDFYAQALETQIEILQEKAKEVAQALQVRNQTETDILRQLGTTG